MKLLICFETRSILQGMGCLKGMNWETNPESGPSSVRITLEKCVILHLSEPIVDVSIRGDIDKPLSLIHI